MNFMGENSGGEMPKSNPDLEPDEILKAEYEYIASTIFQANEDRSRVASFYFVSVGSIVAAILGTQFATDKLQGVSFAFTILFLVLTVLGAITIAQLARLRAAWHESVEAMNQLKDFYIKQRPEIKSAFKWRATTIPPTDKRFSIANLIAIEVELLGGMTAAAAVYFAMVAFGKTLETNWWFILAGFAVGYIILLIIYKLLLVDDR